MLAMDDSELQAIRRARLAELQRSQARSGSSVSAGSQPQAPSDGQAAQEEEARAAMIAQILTPSARERLSRIRIVKAQKAKGVEDLLIQMARTGQIQSRVDEDELISLLDQISRQESKANETKIVYQTRRFQNFDDDDDLDLDL
ncbi:double-stranded DNA-binding domain-containing protein [Lipomyces oligophaga]|uniref:double-stranded DNA-binding domain-containing protein n=1 Tax=Lipomyces oligophaga TaxID=45792 RepID=UPI0034CF45A2